MAILKKVQLRGCTLEPAALKEVERYLDEAAKKAGTEIGCGVNEVLPKVLEALADASTSRVSGDMMKQAIVRVSRAEGGAGDGPPEELTVIQLAEVPRLYWSDRTQGFAASKEPCTLLGPPQQRVAALIERLLLIRQRLVRTVHFKRHHHSIYNDQSVAMAFQEAADEKPPLYRLSSLEGTPEHTLVTVLARLSRAPSDDFTTKPNDGEVIPGRLGHKDKFVLEDESSRVDVNFLFEAHQMAACCTPGIFHDGVIVVAIGRWKDEAFCCEGMGMPPAEPRVESIAALPTFVDFFGRPPPANQARALKEKEAGARNTVFFLSDVHPSQPASLLRVAKFFAGLAADRERFPPNALAIVLAGNFSREPFSYGDTLSCRQQPDAAGTFAKLMADLGAAIAGAAPAVAKEAQFIVVPGPNDPAAGGGTQQFLPSLPVPDVLMEGAKAHLGNVTLASNPARLRFLTQEIVFFREEAYRRLMAHCLAPPVREPINVTLVKTVADQAHLLPLPPRFSNVCAAYDSAMRLYPLPSLVVLADHDKSWITLYKDCPFVNPGSFSRH
eukprot:gene15230-23262_t